MSSTPSEAEIAAAQKVLFDAGIAVRTEVAGKKYVDAALSNAQALPFHAPMQQFVTQACWGSVWNRPGLPKKTRSLLNVAMLCVMNRGVELKVHVRGAVNNGCTAEEIQEVILQAATYGGMPAGIEGFRLAGEVLEEMGVIKRES